MTGTTANAALRPLLEDFSLEMTGKDTARLEAAQSTIPPGTRVNVTFLGNEDLAMRVDAAAAVRRLGLVPIPHVSARRLPSADALRDFLAALQEVGAVDRLFTVGGDPVSPEGPYTDSLAVIRSGLLEAAGAAEIGISGYPEGHPDIDDAALWSALEAKAAALREAQLAGFVITQFGFDVAPVIRWIEEVRARGIDLPIRVGVPGPAGIRRLLAFAARFGVGSSAGIAKKYGFSITNLLGTAGPDRFLLELADRLDPAWHGTVRLHFYTFGGIEATASWIDAFAKEH